MAPCRPALLSLLVVFGLLILSTEGRGVQEKLSPDVTAGSFLRGKDEHLERSRLIPDQLLHNEKVLDTFLVGSDQQTMADRLQSAAEISPSCTQEVLVPTRSTDPSDGNTGQENGSEPQQRLPVSRKLLYNQTVCESEPNQQNPQMDQAAHEADPVSRTSRTAPSPDGPLVEFDQQQIVMLADDEVVRTAAASLYHKHPAVSSLHAVRPQHRVRQVKGQAAPLSERSSLVLVGHGAREPSGEMRISGYSYRDVARIIQSASRIGQKIQTTAVVACGVGSDRRFPPALLQTLHEAGLETELHLWKTAVQVAETGDVLSQDGARWRSGDLTKKLVLTVGRTGEIRRRDDRRRTGQEVPTNQTALLGDGDDEPDFREQWPTAKRSFIDNNIYEKVVSYLTGSEDVKQEQVDKVRETFRILEGLTWGLFYPEFPGGRGAAQPLRRVQDPDLDRFIIGKRDGPGKVVWLDNNGKENVLQRCYVIETGSDIRNIIRHFARVGENADSYLLINDWLFLVQPDSLYVYPIGRRFSEDEDGSRNAVQKLIQQQNQEGNERYENIKKHIHDNERKNFVNIVTNIFRNQPVCLDFNSELFSVWYFTASVIAESARNFRTFPLTLMALNMKNKRFWFDPKYITMADGGTWLNKPLRGFSGSAEGYPEKLAALLGREYMVMRAWQQTTVKNQQGADEFTVMAEAAQKLNVLAEQEKNEFIKDCREFVVDVKNQQNLPSASGSFSTNEQREGPAFSLEVNK
ncbi:uncharacterized protein LOC116730165 [Xiphophorus hellerii]|uniref:uncharacterized protein LOC116730165 n=1 Tax=Xiphophorus hellerii TaxID=8084 RepID=UPI0013B43A29|nr:uncharacterized protein LOC116730165 [Xiphophorus hellerii]